MTKLEIVPEETVITVSRGSKLVRQALILVGAAVGIFVAGGLVLPKLINHTDDEDTTETTAK